MFEVSQGLKEKAVAAATRMLADAMTIAPIATPEGNAMFHVSTDKSRLRSAFLEIEVNGSTVYVGMLA